MMRVIETGTGVVGREHELATLRSFIVDTDTPAAVVIDGDAGIGKTTVWDAGIEAAEAAGHRVLRCRPVLTEAQLSFAAVGDLLDDVLEDALPTLPAPQQHALRVALLIDEPDGPAPDVRAIAGAVLGVLRHLCADRPVLLAVDDVQWLDDPSRTVLEFVIRRLREEPIRLLVARRGVAADLPLGLARALAPSALEHMTLAPLSLGALHRLLQTRLGAAFPRPVLRRLYATSGGNPFYTLELGRALERHRGTLGPEEPLPVPTTLQELVQDRVNAQPERVRMLLELVAALYDRHLAAVVELARADGLDGAIDEAIAAGVLAVARGPARVQPSVARVRRVRGDGSRTPTGGPRASRPPRRTQRGRNRAPRTRDGVARRAGCRRPRSLGRAGPGAGRRRERRSLCGEGRGADSAG